MLNYLRQADPQGYKNRTVDEEQKKKRKKKEKYKPCQAERL
jgi:hypothetical protein